MVVTKAILSYSKQYRGLSVLRATNDFTAAKFKGGWGLRAGHIESKLTLHNSCIRSCPQGERGKNLNTDNTVYLLWVFGARLKAKGEHTKKNPFINTFSISAPTGSALHVHGEERMNPCPNLLTGTDLLQLAKTSQGDTGTSQENSKV